MDKRLTGKVDRSAIKMLELPHIPKEVIDGLKALGDLTSTVSDAMDELGLAGVVPASVLKPTLPPAKIVGPALTLRNVEQPFQALHGARERSSKLAEIEAHNLAQLGDVLVIEGIDGVSNMGGISSAIAKRQGEAAAIVDGSIRDVEQSQEMGFPRWARSISPITGKWRIRTVEINGVVSIAGVSVSPGDLVVADSDGVCFVPNASINAVYGRVMEITRGEKQRYIDIENGMDVPELANKTYVYQYS